MGGDSFIGRYRSRHCLSLCTDGVRSDLLNSKIHIGGFLLQVLNEARSWYVVLSPLQLGDKVQ